MPIRGVWMMGGGPPPGFLDLGGWLCLCCAKARTLHAGGGVVVTGFLNESEMRTGRLMMQYRGFFMKLILLFMFLMIL